MPKFAKIERATGRIDAIFDVLPVMPPHERPFFEYRSILETSGYKVGDVIPTSVPPGVFYDEGTVQR